MGREKRNPSAREHVDQYMPAPALNRAFGARLKKTITASGEDHKLFAKKCGLSEGQIDNYLSGKHDPSAIFLRKLKEHYPSVDLNWLITGQRGPQIKPNLVGKIVPMDLAVGLLMEVEAEIGFALNERQRDAAVAILRKEIERSFADTRKAITNLIESFKAGNNG